MTCMTALLTPPVYYFWGRMLAKHLEVTCAGSCFLNELNEFDLTSQELLS